VWLFNYSYLNIKICHERKQFTSISAVSHFVVPVISPTKLHSRPIKQDIIFSEYLNCTKFGQLILRKITKIVATRWHISRLKCTKFDFSWGSAPDPSQRSPRPLAGFKDSYL